MSINSSRRTVALCALLLSAAPASADDVVPVEAAVISVLPDNYDGKRVRTEMSLMTPLNQRASKSFCGKGKVGFMLGPQLRPGQPPAMLAGTWILCVSEADAPTIAVQPMGTPLVFEATVKLRGGGAARTITMNDLAMVSIGPEAASN